MKAKSLNVWGNQGDHQNLPVPDIGESISLLENKLGFYLEGRGIRPNAFAVLSRDDVRIGFVENEGVSSQAGCFIEVNDIDLFLCEFQPIELINSPTEIKTEEHNGTMWRVFYLVATNGLSVCFGQRQK